MPQACGEGFDVPLLARDLSLGTCVQPRYRFHGLGDVRRHDKGFARSHGPSQTWRINFPRTSSVFMGFWDLIAALHSQVSGRGAHSIDRSNQRSSERLADESRSRIGNSRKAGGVLLLVLLGDSTADRRQALTMVKVVVMMNYNRRNGFAAQRFAERRRREDEAPRLSEQVRDLESLRLELEERCGDTGASPKYTRRFVVARAPALFFVPCGDPRCLEQRALRCTMLGSRYPGAFLEFHQHPKSLEQRLAAEDSAAVTHVHHSSFFKELRADRRGDRRE